jgi:hypothetical protein
MISNISYHPYSILMGGALYGPVIGTAPPMSTIPSTLPGVNINRGYDRNNLPKPQENIPLNTQINNSNTATIINTPAINSLPAVSPLLPESNLPEETNPPDYQILSPPVSSSTEVTETPIINNPNLTTPKKASTKKTDTDSDEGVPPVEETVTAILGKRLNKRRHREEWKTKWGDGTITWEPKENFVDYEDGVEIANAHWLEFEQKEAEKKKIKN